MLQIDFVENGAIVHSITSAQIESYKLSGEKLIADDFFMNEPASAELSIITDAWLLERWEDNIVKTGKDGVWFATPVKVSQKNPETGGYDTILSGIIDLTSSSFDPVRHRIGITIYDYSALLCNLDIPVRIYYPYSPATGTDWSKFILNYPVSEEEAENPATQPEEGPYFPFPNSLTTPSRQVGQVIEALCSIWQAFFASKWDLLFDFAFNDMSGSGAGWAENYIVAVASADSFYSPFVLGIVAAAWQAHNPASDTYQINYGLLPSDARAQIYAQYSLLPPADADAYLVMRAGFNSAAGGAHEWYRIFALKDGCEIWDSGQKHYALGTGSITFASVGTAALAPANTINLPNNELYRSSVNDLNIPSGSNPAAYLASMAFYIYFNGIIQDQAEYSDSINVAIDNQSGFGAAFVNAIALPVYNQFKSMPTPYKAFWANYGLIHASQRNQIFAEYSLTTPDQCDAFFIMRAGITYAENSKDHSTTPENPHYPWTDGEGGGGGGGGSAIPSQFTEKYRILALANGVIVKDYGIRSTAGYGILTGNSVGNVALSPANSITLGENNYYHCSVTSLSPPEGTLLIEYLINQNYRLLYTGYSPGATQWLANRIFRMKSIPDKPGHEQFIELKLKDWLKYMFFIANVACHCDSSGTIRISPRLPLDDAAIPWNLLISAKKNLLIYQPWDEEKLFTVINDRAEIKYLISYYGGSRSLTHTIDLDFIRKGFNPLPTLRQKFAFNPAQTPNLELLGAGSYMITSLEFDGVKRLKLKAIKIQ